MQADLSLRWSYKSYYRLCHALTLFYWNSPISILGTCVYVRLYGVDIPRENKMAKLQSTFVISKSMGLSEILRDIHTSTYQIYRIKEK